MQVKIEESWNKVLSGEFDKEYFAQLTQFVKSEYLTATVYPPPKFIFRAFELTPFEAVKVVILGQDPYHGPNQANGLCLSFYVADNALAFEPLMINNQDIYFHFWLPHMTVLYDDGVSGDLIRQNQNWLKCFPNLHLEFTPLWPAASRLAKFLRWVSLPFIRPMWERWCKKIQLRLLPSNLAAVANKDTSVVINDQVLKFHNPDRRAYYYKEWQTKLANLNI